MRLIQKWIDLIIGFLLLLMTVAVPWAFGVVHDEAIFIFNCVSYLAFALHVLGQILGRTSRKKDTWLGVLNEADSQANKRVLHSIKTCNHLLVLCFGLLLSYVLIHSFNYRAEFDSSTLTFYFRDISIPSMPHSYDRAKTISVFWNYLALGFMFLVARSWLLRLSRSDLRMIDRLRSGEKVKPGDGLIVGRRNVILISVIVFNGLVVSAVGILQRLGANDRLVWILEPVFSNPGSHFGPFAYRGNASTFLNLLIPLGFLVAIHFRERYRLEGGDGRIGGSPLPLMFPALGLLMVSPFVTTSRAGGGVALLMIVACLLRVRIILRMHWRQGLVAALVISGIVVSLGIVTNADEVLVRYQKTFSNNELSSGLQRFQIYKNSKSILEDHYLWGVGPGAFSSVYFMSRDPEIFVRSNWRLEPWAAWAHSDPLEMLVTFGVVGFALMLLWLGLVVIQPLLLLGRTCWRSPLFFLILALAGFLLHSCVDFPFQIYGLLFYFIICAGLVTSVSVPRYVLQVVAARECGQENWPKTSDQC